MKTKPYKDPNRGPIVVDYDDLIDFDGEQMTVDDRITREWASGRKNGFESGVKTVVARIRAMAGDLFAAGKDERAIILRGLAADLEKEIKA